MKKSYRKRIGGFLFGVGLMMWVAGYIFSTTWMKPWSMILVLLGLGMAAVFRDP